MIVTHFYRRGLFGRNEWLTNKRDALSGRLNMKTLYGYHVWAPHVVKLMRQYPVVEKMFLTLFTVRNRSLSYIHGKTEKSSVWDHLARIVLEVPSMVIGFMGFRPNHDFNYGRIYGTEEDNRLIGNGYYVRQPQGMIGW